MSLLIGNSVYVIPSAHAAQVFRSIDSPLPSGDYSTKELRKNQKRIISQSWFFVHSGRQRGWVPRRSSHTHWDFVRFARIKNETVLRAEPDWTAPISDSLPAGRKIEILSMQDHWAFIKQGKTSWWINTLSLEPVPEDFGWALIKGSASLLEAKTLKPKGRLRAGTKLQIQGIQGDYFLVKDSAKRSGLVRISATLSVLDFAVRVRAKNKKRWLRIVRKRPKHLILADQNRLKFENIEAIQPSASTLFTNSARTKLYNSPDYKNPKPTSLSGQKKLLVKQNRINRWVLSKVNREDLWWRYEKPKSHLPRTFLSTEELFARKVFAMESSPAKPNLMFASARGVFSSDDGRKWQPVPGFESKDYPIAIAKSGTVLIGSRRSDDHGRTFQEYIPWHKVAKIVNKKHPKSLFLEVRKVKFLDEAGKTYSITIDNGKSLVSIVTPDNGKSWVATP